MFRRHAHSGIRIGHHTRHRSGGQLIQRDVLRRRGVLHDRDRRGEDVVPELRVLDRVIAGNELQRVMASWRRCVCSGRCRQHEPGRRPSGPLAELYHTVPFERTAHADESGASPAANALIGPSVAYPFARGRRDDGRRADMSCFRHVHRERRVGLASIRADGPRTRGVPPSTRAIHRLPSCAGIDEKMSRRGRRCPALCSGSHIRRKWFHVTVVRASRERRDHVARVVAPCRTRSGRLPGLPALAGARSGSSRSRAGEHTPGRHVVRRRLTICV